MHESGGDGFGGWIKERRGGEEGRKGMDERGRDRVGGWMEERRGDEERNRGGERRRKDEDDLNSGKSRRKAE